MSGNLQRKKLADSHGKKYGLSVVGSYECVCCYYFVRAQGMK